TSPQVTYTARSSCSLDQTSHQQTADTLAGAAGALPRGTMASSTDPGRGDSHSGLALRSELLLSLPVGVAYVAGPDLIFEFANDESRRYVGGRDLIGLPLSVALPELPRERLARIARVRQQGQPFQGRDSEVWIRRHGQEPEQMFVDFVFQPVPD